MTIHTNNTYYNFIIGQDNTYHIERSAGLETLDAAFKRIETIQKILKHHLPYASIDDEFSKSKNEQLEILHKEAGAIHYRAEGCNSIEKIFKKRIIERINRVYAQVYTYIHTKELPVFLKLNDITRLVLNVNDLSNKDLSSFAQVNRRARTIAQPILDKRLGPERLNELTDFCERALLPGRCISRVNNAIDPAKTLQNFIKLTPEDFFTMFANPPVYSYQFAWVRAKLATAAALTADLRIPKQRHPSEQNGTLALKKAILYSNPAVVKLLFHLGVKPEIAHIKMPFVQISEEYRLEHYYYPNGRPGTIRLLLNYYEDNKSRKYKAALNTALMIEMIAGERWKKDDPEFVLNSTCMLLEKGADLREAIEAIEKWRDYKRNRDPDFFVIDIYAPYLKALIQYSLVHFGKEHKIYQTILKVLGDYVWDTRVEVFYRYKDYDCNNVHKPSGTSIFTWECAKFSRTIEGPMQEIGLTPKWEKRIYFNKYYIPCNPHDTPRY